MEVDKLREDISKFNLQNGPLGSQDYTRVLLQLFGLTGHGKSSFINSCKYVVDDGEFIMYAKVGEGYNAETMERSTYPLTDIITLVDNRGCQKLESFETAEVYAQLGNFMPLDVKVDWSEGYDNMMRQLMESEMDPNYADLIVPLFVYSVEAGIPEEGVNAIRSFLVNCRNMTGIFPIIILTKKTQGDMFKVERIVKNMGAEVVFAVENYTNKCNVKTRGRHADFLKLLHNILEDIRFLMRQQRNPRRDRIQRQQFLLKYIHDQDLVRKENEFHKVYAKVYNNPENTKKKKNICTSS